MRPRFSRHSRTQRKKMARSLLGLVVFLALFWYAQENGLMDDLAPKQTSITQTASTGAFPEIDEDELVVYFLDVGQGNSTLVRIPNGDGTPYFMLIDTGEYEYADGLTETLQTLGVEQIDALVCSHQHSDHMGCMARIIQRFPVEEFYLPQLPDESVPTTAAYESLLQAAYESDLTVVALARGTEIDCPDTVSIDVLAPEPDAGWDDLNNFSGVLRLVFGETSFLFPGDAEQDSEAIMLENGAALSADVLLCGHHGSKTSGSQDFLSAVFPDYAIISCGLGNSYGHPHQETLEKLQELGTEILETDEDGTILAVSDGSTIRITTDLPSVPTAH